jgi:alkylhydroperoxidase family enzyme
VAGCAGCPPARGRHPCHVSESGAAYPLGWHILDALDAGLALDDIRAIVDREDGASLAPVDTAVVAFASRLARDARLDDATFEAVAAHLDAPRIVELTLLVGAYRLVACLANGLAVDLDDAPAGALERLHAAPPAAAEGTGA